LSKVFGISSDMRSTTFLTLAFLVQIGVAWIHAPQQGLHSRQKSFLFAEINVDVCVIGSGISGSCLAHYLTHDDGDKAPRVLMAEARAQVGGNVISRKNDQGFIWEEGPNSFQPTPTVMRTAYEAGIADELVFANPTLPPWVFWEGKLKPLPKNLPGDLFNFDLLTWPGKIRAGLGACGLFCPPPPEDKEETIEEFVTRHLGRECFERIIDPFVSGVYAGDPAKLSMRSSLRKIFRLQTLSFFNGALVPGALIRFQEIAKEKEQNPPDPKWPTYKPGELGSFREGLQTLPNAIAHNLKQNGHRVETEWKLKSLMPPSQHNDWSVIFDTPNGSITVFAKAIVCTAPAHAIGNIIKPLDNDAATALDKVYYPPVASVTVAYPKSSFKMPDLPGFGNLNPRSQNIRTLGTIWSSSLFPNRCPPEYNLLLNYIGGSRDVAIADLTPEQILQQVDTGCRATLLKPDAPPPKLLGLKLWPKAIPQYELRHQPDILDKLDQFESKFPGCYLGGNYRTGVAFGDCVQFGLDQANTIRSYLDNLSLSSTVQQSTTSDVTENEMVPTSR